MRRAMRAARRAIPAHRQHLAAAALARHALGAPACRSARHVAIYLANDGEIATSALLDGLLARGKRVYLPVLRGSGLLFLPYTRGTQLAKNRFGIPEPRRGSGPPRHPRSMDLVFMPLVAFDGAGRRLGMGGGFYDRTFAYLREGRAWGRPLLIGVAHHLQGVACVPGASWDVPLRAIVTDRRWQRARRTRAPAGPAEHGGN